MLIKTVICILTTLALTLSEGFAQCGDGVLQPGESCDDGNSFNCDACTNSCQIGPSLEMVLISGGVFNMGDESRRSSRNVHEVTVGDFEVSRHEVTVGQYRPCVEAGACSMPSSRGKCQYRETSSAHDNKPVNCVTWQQAQEFVAWCMDGVPAVNPPTSLPSEAQWEYIAQANATRYPTGVSAPSMTEAHYDQRRVGPVDVCSKGSALVDGLQIQTPFELCDFTGNVMEWLQDNYVTPYGDSHPVDGSALELTSGRAQNFYAIRGGAYTTRRTYELESSYRSGARWSTSNARLGFRVACQAPGCQARLPECGDGVVEGTEICDDGNTITEVCQVGESSCVVCASDCTEQAGVIPWTLPMSNMKDFDVSHDGSLTAITFNNSTGELYAHCFDPSGGLQNTVHIETVDLDVFYGVSATVVRAGTTHESAIGWHYYNKNYGSLGFDWRARHAHLDADCNLSMPADQLDVELGPGIIRQPYLGITHQGTSVYAYFNQSGQKHRLLYFDPTGTLLRAIDYGEVWDQCENMGMNRLTGDVVTFCFDGNGSRRFQRFDIAGDPIDPQPVSFPFNHYTWTYQHEMQMNESGDFVYIEKDTDTDLWNAIFFDATGAIVTEIATGIDPQNERILTTSDGYFVFGARGDREVYSPAGVLLGTSTAGGQIRLDGSDTVFREGNPLRYNPFPLFE